MKLLVYVDQSYINEHYYMIKTPQKTPYSKT